MLPRSFSHGSYLLLSVLNLFAAGAARGSHKILRLVAAAVYTPDHQNPAARVTPLAPHKGGAAAKRAGNGERRTAARTNGIAALDLF